MESLSSLGATRQDHFTSGDHIMLLIIPLILWLQAASPQPEILQKAAGVLESFDWKKITMINYVISLK